MSKKFESPKKNIFIKTLPDISFENMGLPSRCKFNFSFFDSTQEAGQDFTDWDHNSLTKLLDKLKYYSKENLEYWRHSRCGAGGLTVFENYKSFPKKSKFKHPKHVPHNVEWVRFRLEQKVRLIGFILPKDFESRIDESCSINYDSNTFYVVFLDREHHFYIAEDD